MSNPLVSVEAEQAVIGSVLLAPQVFDDVASLQSEDFAIEENRTLWGLIRKSEQNRDLVGLITSCRDLSAYIGELVRNTPSAANIRFYASVVQERATLRRIAAAATKVAGVVSNGSLDAASALAMAIREIEGVSNGAGVEKGLSHIGDLACEWNTEFQRRMMAGGEIIGLSTGFGNLDRRIQGMRGGQVIVIAGRPKMGKSTLAMNIAQNVSRDHPVALFNLEMGATELIDRAVSYFGRLPLGQIRNGQLHPDSTDYLISACQQIKESRLYINDTPAQTLDGIRLNAKAFVKKHGHGLIVIDYLQLVRIPSIKNRYEEVSEVSRGMKLLAKETNCPVIALSQMNRAIEGASRKPQLSDLRETGAIEQDADIVAFAHKDDVEQDYVEIITRAHRNGAPGTDYLGCEFSLSAFRELPEGWEPPQPEPPHKQARGRGGFNRFTPDD